MSKTIRAKEHSVIIEKLAQARKEKGFRQVDVVKLLKRPQSYIARVESGKYHT